MKVGLTGGIGSGKSAVARMLAEHDLPTQCARMGAAFAEVEAAHR